MVRRWEAFKKSKFYVTPRLVSAYLPSLSPTTKMHFLFIVFFKWIIIYKCSFYQRMAALQKSLNNGPQRNTFLWSPIRWRISFSDSRLNEWEWVCLRMKTRTATLLWCPLQQSHNKSLHFEVELWWCRALKVLSFLHCPIAFSALC